MGGVYCIKCNEKIRTVNSGRNYASICNECTAEIEKNMTPEDRLAHAKVGMAALIDEACGFQKTRPKDSLKNLLNIERMKADKEFMDGIKKGVRDCKEGRTRPWSEIKKELNLDTGTEI